MRELELSIRQGSSVEMWAQERVRNGEGKQVLDLNTGNGTSAYLFDEGLVVLYNVRKRSLRMYPIDISGRTIMFSSCKVAERLAHDGISLPEIVLHASDKHAQQLMHAGIIPDGNIVPSDEESRMIAGTD